MSIKERLIQFLQNNNFDDVIAALTKYFEYESDNFYATDIANFILEMQKILSIKVADLDFAVDICHEKGVYLRDYLEGKMWATEESAKKNVQPQIDNAKTIVETCKR